MPELLTQIATPVGLGSGGGNVLNLDEVEGVRGTGFEMFWIDMWEDKFKAPGRLFMFGKYQPSPDSEDTKSVMVEIQNVPRVLYVLPRGDSASDEAGRSAVKEEVLSVFRQRLGSQEGLFFSFSLTTALMTKKQTAALLTHSYLRHTHDTMKRHKVKFKTKWEELSYAFELPQIPRGKSTYLKVVYSMGLEKSSAGPLESGSTFSHVFGVNQTAIEALILQFKLMGPSWIRIQNPVSVERRGASWCKYEALMDFEKQGSLSIVSNRPPPKLSVLSLSLKTIVDPASHQHEIVAATAVLQESVALANSDAAQVKPPKLAFSLVRAPPGGQVCVVVICLFIERCSTDSHLLNILAHRSRLVSCLPITSWLRPLKAPCSTACLQWFVCCCYCVILGVCFKNKTHSFTFFLQLHNIDPDFLLGHNIEGFELDLLITRMKVSIYLRSI